MKRYAIILSVVAALGIYAAMGRADSTSIGKTTLSATVLEYTGDAIVASGNANLLAHPPKDPMKLGSVRLESIKAENITVEMAKGAGNKLVMKQATANGGVVIKAKRADKDTNQAGETVTIIRDVKATAQTAVLPQTQDSIKLTGNVVVRITEPGVTEPVAELTGRTVTMSLKDNKIRIEGQSDKPAELTVTPKEGEKK